MSHIPHQSACMVTTKCLVIHFIGVHYINSDSASVNSVVVANTMLMYKMQKLRSHFLSHLYAVMHDARPSLFYLCGLVCGLAVRF